VSTSFCAAVGSSGEHNGSALVDMWNGQAWQPAAVPSPPASSLLGVSCTSVDACMAVGLADASPMAERWDGHTWSVRVMQATGYNDQLQSVSCVSATFCTAVGSKGEGGGYDASIIEHWDGQRWTSQTAAASGRGSDSLWGVSCVTSANCFAVGESDTVPQYVARQLVEHWDGHRWSLVSLPQPAEAESSLRAITCANASCVAAGALINAKTQTHSPYIIRFNGSKWSPDHAAQAPLANSILLGVTCPTTTTCVAVGEQSNSPQLTNPQALAERAG
jgi:hypothetical protein